MDDSNEQVLKDLSSGVCVLHNADTLSEVVAQYRPFWVITYIAKGIRAFRCNGKKFFVQPGDLLLVEPNALNSSENTSSEKVEIYSIFFITNTHLQYSDYLENVFKLFADVVKNLGPAIRIPKEKQQPVKDLFVAIGKEIENRESGYIAQIDSELLQLAVSLLRLPKATSIENVKESVDDKNSNKESVAEEIKKTKIQEILDYLVEHHSEPLTLETVADEFCLSRTYFCHYFKSFTNHTFVEYLNGVRVSFACRYLEKTDMSVTEIAFACGYGSITQFGRKFRNYTKYTPLEYRKTARKHGKREFF